MKILSIDTETGGIGLDKSLLTVSMIAGNIIIVGGKARFDTVGTLNLDIIPNDGIYRVDPRGLAVNKIDLVKLAERADNEKTAGQKVYTFLSSVTNNGKDKRFPLGKNVYGDLGQIWDKLISRNTWENFVSYRAYELSGVIQFLINQGKLPDNLGSLSSVAEYLGISTHNLHTADGDAKLSIEVLAKLLVL